MFGIVLILYLSHEILRVHPNYLMYGAHYSPLLVGDFENLAAYHCQGMGEVLDWLHMNHPDARIISMRGGCNRQIDYYNRKLDLDVSFFSFNMSVKDVLKYDYAILDWFALNKPYDMRNNGEYPKIVVKYCTKEYAYGGDEFETIWAYRCGR